MSQEKTSIKALKIIRIGAALLAFGASVQVFFAGTSLLFFNPHPNSEMIAKNDVGFFSPLVVVMALICVASHLILRKSLNESDTWNLAAAKKVGNQIKRPLIITFSAAVLIMFFVKCYSFVKSIEPGTVGYMGSELLMLIPLALLMVFVSLGMNVCYQALKDRKEQKQEPQASLEG